MTVKSIALALMLILGVGGLVSCASPADDQLSIAAQGSSAPGQASFTLASLNGDQISTADFAGQVVLIDFWATWCGPCHYQADILEKLHEDFADQDVQFLAVSLGESEEIVRSFIEENPYPYPVLIDPEDRLSPEFGIYVLPTVMVLDREGNVSYQQSGVSQAEALRRALYEAGVEHPSSATS